MDTQGLGGFLAFIIGWTLAQGGKILLDVCKRKKIPTGRELIDAATRSGGMPSGHTASFLSLTVYIGMQYGFKSGIFAVAACTMFIVIYDAVNVRYAVGEQGKLLNIMVMDGKYSKRKLKVVEGHTVPQVVVGAIIGVIVGVLMGLAF